jgi:hypothetical protein
LAHQNAGALIDELSHKYSGEQWAEKQMRPNQAGDFTRRGAQCGDRSSVRQMRLSRAPSSTMRPCSSTADSKPSRGAELITAAAWFLLLPSNQSM